MRTRVPDFLQGANLVLQALHILRLITPLRQLFLQCAVFLQQGRQLLIQLGHLFLFPSPLVASVLQLRKQRGHLFVIRRGRFDCLLGRLR